MPWCFTNCMKCGKSVNFVKRATNGKYEPVELKTTFIVPDAKGQLYLDRDGFMVTGTESTRYDVGAEEVYILHRMVCEGR